MAVSGVKWDIPRDADEKNKASSSSESKKRYDHLDTMLEALAKPTFDFKAMKEHTDILNTLYFEKSKAYARDMRYYGSRRFFVVLVRSYMRQSLDKLGKKTLVDSFSDSEQDAYQALIMMRYWLGNFCNSDPNRLQIGEYGVVADLCEELKQATEVAKKTNNYALYHESHINYSINILWNCATLEGTKPHFREARAVDALVPVLKCTVDVVKAKVMMTLCHIVDESENELLVSDGGKSLDFIITTLGKAAENPNLSFKLPDKNNVYAYGLCQALEALARVEKNKKWITEKKGVPAIVRLLEKAQTTNQRCVAAQALWQLAFDETARKEILATKAVSLLEPYKTSSNSELKEAAKGALWELRDKPNKEVAGPAGQIQRIRSARIRSAQASRKGAAPQADGGHIMLSYQGAFRETVLKVRDSLKKQGFKTWMDVDQMEAHLYESMASAVEEATCVISFFSESYKDSAPCRSEACYAQDRRVPIIAVKVEPQYKPDGWLGFLISGQKYIDLSGKFPFDNMCKDLLDRIKEVMQGVSGAPSGGSGPAPAASASTSGVEKWTTAQVAEHLTKHSVKLDSDKLKGILGDELKCLKELSVESPEFFNNYLKDELGLKNLTQLTAMRRAIQNLSV